MCSYASTYKMCVPTLPNLSSTGRLERAVPAHALADCRISWHGRRFCPRRGEQLQKKLCITGPHPIIAWVIDSSAMNGFIYPVCVDVRPSASRRLVMYPDW